MEKKPAVYILCNRPNGTLYIGVTSNLPKRIWEHRSKTVKGFTAKYNVTRLIWFELFETMDLAIEREKQLKGRPRKAKVALIEDGNPVWRDLFEEICG
ncbi:endonuclease [Thiohalobacter sp. COW1]|uniref:Excinuclease ABC C subunit domain-containing protein n=1 Tax=Thiohalobacter thiocyanaticus TaxID=585455 RepID=A0A1Z4VV43_9GAMM|nr:MULTISPECIES: GIY-YIG nuclease family protein [Thiohalobacter]BAZ95332.1 excinuclease ABC C subunit domain-containing protein [Thiohalobacter thiocyanaticus]BCO32716.1 endonuclease [Thiohalobacter sp. COW1]